MEFFMSIKSKERERFMPHRYPVTTATTSFAVIRYIAGFIMIYVGLTSGLTPDSTAMQNLVGFAPILNSNFVSDVFWICGVLLFVRHEQLWIYPLLCAPMMLYSFTTAKSILANGSVSSLPYLAFHAGFYIFLIVSFIQVYVGMEMGIEIQQLRKGIRHGPDKVVDDTDT